MKPEQEEDNTSRGVLFLCVANSARSQMAEGFGRRFAPPGTPIYSAGSNPSTVNPYAIQVMSEVGIDLAAHRSKGVDEVPAEAISTAITLCAEEVCPIFPHPVEKLHWPHPDPAAATGGEEMILQSFRQVRDNLEKVIRDYFATRA